MIRKEEIFQLEGVHKREALDSKKGVGAGIRKKERENRKRGDKKGEGLEKGEGLLVFFLVSSFLLERFSYSGFEHLCKEEQFHLRYT